MEKSIRYTLISTPRSGTTHLCSLLKATGRMGNPEEYFNEDLIPFFREKLKKENNPQSYLDKIIWQSRMANDCVGVNLNSKESFELAKNHKWVDKTTHWIRLKREDKILQAISLYKAWETRKWHHYQKSTKEDISYSFEKINNSLEYLIQQEKFIDNLNLENVLEISYESDLLEDEYSTIYCILDFVGLPLDGMGKLTSTMKVLRDNESFSWKKRFIEDSKERK